MGWINGFEPSASRATIWRSNQLSYTHHILACLERLELPTYCLEGSCSILLSYGRINGRLLFIPSGYFVNFLCKKMEQVMGIEPTCSAWKADILPLNYTCDCQTFVNQPLKYITERCDLSRAFLRFLRKISGRQGTAARRQHQARSTTIRSSRTTACRARMGSA